VLVLGSKETTDLIRCNGSLRQVSCFWQQPTPQASKERSRPTVKP